MMKKSNQKKNMPHAEKRERPTMLEFFASLHYELCKPFGLEVKIDPELPITPLPDWAKKIVTKLGKTIIKPVLKLRPSPKFTYQDYGKIIGLVSRGITFYREDARKTIEAEGLDKINDEVWEKFQPSDQLRVHVIKQLGRTVSEDEILEHLIDELTEQRIKLLEDTRTRSFQEMARRGAKDNAMFFKGIEQGYKIFMDEDGHFCGDRGRTEIYMELISSVYEIEKMRRILPARNDSDLYEHLKPWYRFPNGQEAGIDWLRDVCDDISLYMTGKRGRPPGPQRAPVF